MSENLAEPMIELSRPPILDALEPSRSVVVEACAGSGKTWLLASRIVRLLLSGIAPGEILAITFTRKAAREIEERVVDWLHLLATGSDAQVLVFLGERGVSADTALLRNARGQLLCDRAQCGWVFMLKLVLPVGLLLVHKLG